MTFETFTAQSMIPQGAVIPTLSQWGVFILGLALIIGSVIALQARRLAALRA